MGTLSSISRPAWTETQGGFEERIAWAGGKEGGGGSLKKALGIFLPELITQEPNL
jgi:hypothetical protein